MGWPTDPRPAKCLLTLRDQVDDKYPGRAKGSDGMIGDAAHQAEGSASDHNPWFRDSQGRGVVTAIDITHDPAHGLVIAHLAAALAKSRDHRIKYIITNRRILDSRPDFNPWVWMPYSGSDPHTGHLHLSVVTTQSRYDATRPWTALEDWFDMADKNDLKAAIREMLPDIAKAVRDMEIHNLSTGGTETLGHITARTSKDVHNGQTDSKTRDDALQTAITALANASASGFSATASDLAAIKTALDALTQTGGGAAH
jgi:hypothetical protein